MQPPGPPSDREQLEASAAAQIQRVIDVSVRVFDELEALHERLVRAAELLPGWGRELAPAAELGAHCIGLARALIALIEGSFSPHAVPTQRALREAYELLEVVRDPEEGALAVRWIEQRNVRPSKVRAALDRGLRRTLAAMDDRGERSSVAVDPDWLKSRGSKSYQDMSGYVHHAREAVCDLHALTSDGYCYGPERSIARRYATAVAAHGDLGGAAIQVGLALTDLDADDEFLEREIEPLLAEHLAAAPDVDYLQLLLVTHA